MKYYDRIIKRGYYDTVLYRKKTGKGKKRKSGYLYLAPTRSRNLPLRPIRSQMIQVERAQPGTSVCGCCTLTTYTSVFLSLKLIFN